MRPKKLLNKKIVRTENSMADIVQRAYPIKDDEQNDEQSDNKQSDNEQSDNEQSDNEQSDKKYWTALGREKWTHWKVYPVSECWKDRCATIRCALSGNEIYVQLGDIKELKTVRKDYVHLKDFHDLVRERLCLR